MPQLNSERLIRALGIIQSKESPILTANPSNLTGSSDFTRKRPTAVCSAYQALRTIIEALLRASRGLAARLALGFLASEALRVAGCCCWYRLFRDD